MMCLLFYVTCLHFVMVHTATLPHKNLDDGVTKGCRGADNNPNGYPGQIPTNTITGSCRKSDQYGGYYFLITWGQPIDAKTKPASGYQVTFDYGSFSFICFQVKNNTNQFIFTKKRGFVEGQIYDLAIIPRPTPYALSTKMVRIGKCPDPTYPTLKTRKEVRTTSTVQPKVYGRKTKKARVCG
ncbi:uncharacterized protein LOC130662290 isoform X2 [Hydractinia symbiolongicarpus]|uniref:uncharacterized protein LOC130662290 isoform X2 n=1 Tax=Hydractinia symbiolongicarpus TaxID=13093 RepID=UPI00254E06E8|nr:uncharacterized protein LOC130662290 isoform X2 [Hydractinia symbiolongicarpus]